MVELRVIIVKEYSSILEREILTAFPQCNAQVPIARPRNYGTNNPEIF
jgi:hypothetical protein